MKLKELTGKLAQKPNQEVEVEFLVYEKESGDLVCCDLTGPSTTELMKILAKRGKNKATA